MDVYVLECEVGRREYHAVGGEEGGEGPVGAPGGLADLGGKG